MKLKPEQFEGSTLRDNGGNGEVSLERCDSLPDAQKIALGGPRGDNSGVLKVPAFGSLANSAASNTANCAQEFYSVADLAARWRVSRSAVYGYLRGYEVIDFAPAPGRKGHKLVSAETVRQIEREHIRVLR